MFPRSYTVQSWVKNKILSYSAWSSAFLLCCSMAIFSCYVIHTNLIFVFFFSTGALNQLILLITRTGSRRPKMALQSEKLPAMRDDLLEARPKCWNSTSAMLSVSLKFPWLSFFSWASLNGPASLLTVAFALPFGARLFGGSHLLLSESQQGLSEGSHLYLGLDLLFAFWLFDLLTLSSGFAILLVPYSTLKDWDTGKTVWWRSRRQLGQGATITPETGSNSNFFHGNSPSTLETSFVSPWSLYVTGFLIGNPALYFGIFLSKLLGFLLFSLRLR